MCSAWLVAAFICWRNEEAREFIAYAQTEAQTELRQGGIALGGLGRVY